MTIDYYYHWLSGPCRYVSMVIKYLNLDVNYKVFDISKGEQKDPEFLKVNPAGQIPAINDNGFYLSESLAIAQYLCNKYAPDSQLYPKDPQKRAQVERLIYFSFTTLMTKAKDIYFPKLFRGEEPTEEAIKQTKEKLSVLNNLIGNNKYLTGDHVTLADFSAFITAFYLQKINFDFNEFANIKKWINTISAEQPHIVEIAGRFDGYEEFRDRFKQKLGLK